MQVLPLVGGSYSARSIVANGQRCINLFPEPNRSDSPTKMTHYQRPGLVPLVSPSYPAVGRGIYRASNGDGYCVIGTVLYYISPSWTLTSLGNISSAWSNGTNPVSMVDNGIQLMIVDGVRGAGGVSGTVTFGANPSNNDTVTLNGVVWTFKTVPVNPTDILIGSTTAITITTLRLALLASTNPLLIVATYSSVGGVLQIVYLATGAAGVGYTLAASVGTPSGAHLEAGIVTQVGGGFYVDLNQASASSVVKITDPSWTGADLLTYNDTFILWNVPGTSQFGCTLSNQIEPLDATYFASKTTWPDPIQGLIVASSNLFLYGQLKGEMWYNAGNAAFPFARQPGTSVEHGMVAKFSICCADVNIYFLSQDLQGQGYVMRARGNDIKRISNFAIEYAMSQMSTISDAVAYCYQIAGHMYYVLSFPTANQTWVWDESVGEPNDGWSQRAWTDSTGTLNRDRGAFGAFLYGKNVCLDWENGTIYEQSQSTYTDTIQTINSGTTTSQSYPISYIRTFPHLMMGKDPNSGQPMLSNGHLVKHERFAIDADLGNAGVGVNPLFSLQYSDDRGKTWSGKTTLVAGEQGQYGTRPDARALGIAMDRVYELSWTFPGTVALNGAWVEGTVLGQ